MRDNRNNQKIAKTTDAPLVTRNNSEQSDYYRTSAYGKANENQTKIELLREWLRIIYRYKWLIFSIVLVTSSFATIQAYRIKSVYQATTTIDISSETSSLSKSGEVLIYDSRDNTRAETVIIKSIPIIKQTIKRLNLDKNPHFLEVGDKRSIKEAFDALRGWKGPKVTESDGKIFDGKIINASIQKVTDKEPITDVTETVKSEIVISPAKPTEIFSDTGDERMKLEPYVQTLLDNLKVEGLRETRLVRISFTHTDPEIAARVANGVADSFIAYNFQKKTERFINTSNWLEESTRKLKAQVEEAEENLASYSRENNIFSLEGKENLTADKMVKLHDQVMRAETDRLLKQSLFEEVKQGRGSQLPEAFSDPKTGELRKSYNELAVMAAQLNVKFGSKHPKLIEIRQQMATLQDQISANQQILEEKLKANYARAVSEENSLKTALAISQNEAVRQNQAAIKYSVLQQNLATAKSLYTDFLNKTSQANIQRAEQFNNVRLIEAAEPPGGPIGPNRKMPIILSLLLSLTIGIGLAYLMENLNTTLRTVDDVYRVTQLPMLAVIPTLNQFKHHQMIKNAMSAPPKINISNTLKRKKLNGTNQKVSDTPDRTVDGSGKLVVTVPDQTIWPAAEAYRMLRTSILLSTAEHPPKTILITSGQPGDGKTTTVFNIAYSLSQLSSEVIIVDCDMRKPNIHKPPQLAKDEGLSALLTSGGDLDKYISTTPVPHLSILPAGALPPNPSELISSDKMKVLLRTLARRFNYVLIDSPPLGAFSDPMILSTLVDGVVLVIKSGQSKGELVRRACQDLSSVGAKVLGITLNGLNVHTEGYDYSQYYSKYFDKSVRRRRNSVSK